MYSHLMFAAGILLISLTITPMIGQDTHRQEGLAQARSGNFMVYRGAVRQYIMDHPGHTGTISDSDLDLPRTYKNMGWNSRADSGEAWVYGDMTHGGLRKIVSLSDQQINLGRKENGELVSPVHGDTGISVPSFVEAGQAAAVIKNT